MSGEVPCAAPDESAAAAWTRRRSTGAEHLVVVRDGEIVGTLSWQDLSGPAGGVHRRMGRSVGDLMRRYVWPATPDTRITRAAATMRRRRVGCLPVVSRRRLVGIVTTSDLLGLLAGRARG